MAGSQSGRAFFRLIALLLSAVAVQFANNSVAFAWCEFTGPGATAHCAQQGRGGANSNAAIIQDAINAFTSSIARSQQDSEAQSQIMQRLEEEQQYQRALERQYDHDFEILKHATTIEDCQNVITPRARDNCIGHFKYVLPAQEQKEREEEAARMAALDEFLERGSDDFLAGFDNSSPTTPAKTSTTNNRVTQGYPVESCGGTDPATQKPYVYLEDVRPDVFNDRKLYVYSFTNSNNKILARVSATASNDKIIGAGIPMGSQDQLTTASPIKNYWFTCFPAP